MHFLFSPQTPESTILDISAGTHTCRMNSQTCRASTGFTKTIRRRYTGQQPGTKSGRLPAGQSLVLFLPSVYIGFPLSVLPGVRPGGLSSIRWRERETVVPWANRSVGVPSCPSSPRPAALPWAAPPRLACGTSGFWIRQANIPRHPLDG